MKKLIFILIVLAGVILYTRQSGVAEPVELPAEQPQPQQQAPVFGRTWTAKDGRTIEGEYISATKDAVTVRRADGTTVTIPFSLLAESDVSWVGRQPKPVVVTQEDINNIVQRFPRPPSLSSGEVTNELKQLHDKYLSMVKFIRPGTIPANLKMIRNKIDADIKVLTEIAATRHGDGSGRRRSGQSKSAENSILSARRSLSWLQGLSSYLKAFDPLAEPK